MNYSKYIAEISTPRRLIISILGGILTSWLTKGIITPLLLQGKSFSGRSLISQTTILVALSIFFTALLYAIFQVYLPRLAERSNPFLLSWEKMNSGIATLRAFIQRHVIFTSVILLLIFFLYGLTWFDKTAYTVLAGDDLGLYLWNVTNHGFFEFVFAPDRGIKLRTLSLILLYIMRGFGGDYQSYFWLNLCLLASLAFMIFYIVRVVTKSNLFSILAGILFMSSRFTFFLIYQAYGAMEMLALAFCLLLFYWLIRYINESDPARARKHILLSIVFFLCLLQAHERYMVNLAVIGLAVLIKRNETLKLRLLYGFLAGLPLLAHFIIATFIVGGDSLNIGQQRATDTLDIVPKYFMVGLINVFGINYAPRWMGGLDFGSYEPGYLLVALLSILPLGYVIGRFILHDRSRTASLLADSQTGLLLFAGMLVNIAPFAITSREEQRFLAMSYTLYLAWFFFCASRIIGHVFPTKLEPHKRVNPRSSSLGTQTQKPRNITVWVAALVFTALIYSSNTYHYLNRWPIYYFTAQSIAQQTYDVIQANHGLGGVEKVYMVGIRDSNWALANGYLFEYYFDATDVKTVFVDALEQVPLEDQDAENVMLIGYDERSAVVRLDQ